jgi:putative acyl-CoA dehydrogenase
MMSTVSRGVNRGATHEVLNQPPPLVDYNAFDADLALKEAVIREGGASGLDRVREFGALIASAEALDHAKRAQRNVPVLRAHDRYGNRIDEVEYDP